MAGSRAADGGATHTVRVARMGERGMGIAHLEGGKALLIPYSAPGDLAVVQIEHQTSSWAQGRIIELKEASRDRIKPPCPYYTRCGGCSLQHVRYDTQLEYKRTVLADVYRAFGLTVGPVEPSPHDMGYRNKLQMQTGGRGGRLVAGFYRAQSHDIVPVDACLLQTAAANALAQDAVRALGQHGVRAARRGGRAGELRDIVVRESMASGELSLTLVTVKPRLRQEDAVSRELFARHPLLRGLYLYHNPHDTQYVFRDGEYATERGRGSPLRRIWGRTLTESFAGMDLETSPVTFFQVNPAQAERIVARIRSILGEAMRPLLVDAYAGVGALSLPLAARFRRVVAVESMRPSAVLAARNAARNGIRSYRVLQGDAERILGEVLHAQEALEARSGGVILVDPPRTGLAPAAREALARSGFALILYLSCDPRTQARDLQEIVRGGTYRVREILPFDMFPQTFHVECLAVVERVQS